MGGLLLCSASWLVVQDGRMSPRTSPPGDQDDAQAPGAPLRADAARNVAQIRAAAIAAFRGRGLDTPLEEIAAAAGVSKATIYNRLGGRAGLIDAVIGNLVAAEIHAIMDKSLQVADPWQAIATYVADRRDLQYREPAFTDALLMTYPDSGQLAAIAIYMTTSLVRRCHDAG
jgi:AcrR family transcriptional regulator